MHRLTRAILIGGLSVIMSRGLSAEAQTAVPHLASVFPTGGQRGTTVEVTFSGVNLSYGTSVVFEGQGLTVESVKQDTTPPANAKNPDGKLIAKIHVAADAALGRHALRVLTSLGPSDVGSFVVRQWPEIAEKEPNNTRDQAQTLAPPITVAAASNQVEDVDWYRITAKQGETFVFQVEAGSIGSPMTPILSLQDSNGHELATAGALAHPDATLAFTASKAGDYFLIVHDLEYQGSAGHLYRLTAGTMPYITGVFPLGGMPGASLNLTLTGYNLPSPPVGKVIMPADNPIAPSSSLVPMAIALPNGWSNVVLLNVGSSPGVQATEAQASSKSGQRVNLPVTADGRLTASGTAPFQGHFYRFRAEKGQRLVCEVMARRAGSSLDSVLTLLNANGQELASNDDALGKDSRLEFAVPETGDYIARIADLNGRAGPDFTYRLSIKIALPDFNLAFTPDCPAVGPGDRIPFTVTATRLYGFDGTIDLDIAGLPSGLHVVGPSQIGAGRSEVGLLLAADGNASVQASALRISGTGTIGGKKVTRGAQSLKEEFVKVGDQINRTTHPTKLPFAVVTLPSDFLLKTGVDTLTLGVGKTVDLAITVTRKAGFTAKIPLSALGLPAGVSVTPLEIPENKSDVKLTFKAEGNAAIGEAKLTLIGRSVLDELHHTEHAATVTLTVTK